MERRITLILAVAVLVIIGPLPLVAMFGQSIDVDGRLTLATYARLFADPQRYGVTISHSLTLASLTSAGATALGVPLGLLLGKTDLPLRRVLGVLFAIPLLLPPYVLAVCWFNLLASNSMIANVIPAAISRWLSDHLFGLPGCLWVLVSAFMPLVMILTMAYLRSINPRLEEAARLHARWPSTLRRITLPMILPGIFFNATLVFLLALGEVGAPMFLRYAVLPVETLTQFAAFYDFGAATAAAMPLLVITLLVLALERRYLRDRVYRLRPTAPRRSLIVPLGPWRVPAVAVVSVLAGAIVILPLISVVASSLSPFGYPEAWSKAGGSLGRSLLLASLGATLLTVLGFLCGYLIHHRALRFWRAVDTLTLLLFTLPGAVLGIGLIALWNRQATSFLYSSAAMVILAYLAQYTAITSRITLATLGNLPQSLEEAAQMTGARWFARIRHVVLPAAFPGVAVAWLIGFIFCLRDLGASMLVYPPGQDTLPVRIYTIMANGAPSLVAAMCVMLVTVTLLSLILVAAVVRQTKLKP